MDPEIKRALKDGHPPAEIAAELTRRRLPVPPELQQMIQQASPQAQPSDATAVATALAPTALAVSGGAAAILGGIKGIGAAKNAIANRAATTQLRRAVNESEGGVQGLIQKLQQFNETGRCGQVTLSDLDPRLTAEADYAATNNPATRNVLSAINTQRRRSQPERLVQDVQQIAPGGYSDAPGLLQQLQQQQRDFAASPQGYEGLRQANPAIDPDGAARLRGFLQEPKLVKAWQDAAAVGAVGPLPKANALSFEVLQGFKDRLYALKEKAWRQGDGDLGRRLNAAYYQLDNIMTESVPGYREVNAKYRAFSQQQEAVQLGQDLWRDKSMQAPEFERRLTGLDPAQRELAQKGILGAYLSDVENARRNSGFFEDMLTRLPVQQRKLELVFGGREGFQRALQTYEQELAMSRLGEAVGGSQTARREAAQATSAAEVVGDAAHAVASPVTAIPSIARKNFARWMPGAVAERMAPAVTTQGSDALETLLRTLMKLPR